MTNRNEKSTSSLLQVVRKIIGVCSAGQILGLTAGVIASLLNGLFLPWEALLVGNALDSFTKWYKYQREFGGANEKALSSVLNCSSLNSLKVTRHRVMDDDWLFDDILKVTTLLVTVGSIAFVIGVIESSLWGALSGKLANNLRQLIFDISLRNRVNNRKNEKKGRLRQMFRNVDGVRNCVGRHLPRLISLFVSVLTILALAFRTNQFLGVIIFVGVLLTSLIAVVCGKAFVKISHEEQTNSERIRDMVKQAVAVSQKDSDGNSSEVIKKIVESFEEAKEYSRKKYSVLALYYGLVVGLTFLDFSGLIWFSGLFFPEGLIDCKGMIIEFNCLFLASFELGDLFHAVINMQEILTLIRGLQNEISTELATEIGAISLKEDVQFQNVCYLENGQNMVEIDVTIPRGKIVCFLGQGRSGNNSIPGLLLRFKDPTSGLILIGKTDIKEINLINLRRNIRLAMSSPRLYDEDGPADQNARPSFERVNALGFVEPETMESRLNLTEGQKLQIALSRATIDDPDILILVLPSNLEACEENTICRSIKLAGAGRTLIVVSQTINFAREVDHVFVMKEGCVVEKGSPEDLLKLQGAYYEMYNNEQNCSKTSIRENHALRERPIEKPGSHFPGVAISTSEREERSLRFKEHYHATNPRIKYIIIITHILAGFIIAYSAFWFYEPTISKITRGTNLEQYSSLSSLLLIFAGIAGANAVFLALYVRYYVLENYAIEGQVAKIKSLIEMKTTYIMNEATEKLRIDECITVWNSIILVVYLFVASALALISSWQLALVQLLFVFIIILFNYTLGRIGRMNRRDEVSRNRAASLLSAWCFKNIEFIHSQSLHSRLSDAHDDLCTVDDSQQWKRSIAASILTGLMNCAPYLLSAVSFIIGVSFVSDRSGTVEGLFLSTLLFRIAIWGSERVSMHRLVRELNRNIRSKMVNAATDHPLTNIIHR